MRKIFAAFFLTASAGAASLHVVGDSNWLSTLTHEGDKVGGLSACAYDDKSGILWALSDDKSEEAPSRIYRLSLKWTSGKGPELRLLNSVTLLTPQGKAFARGDLDAEGMALTPRGTLLVSHEGNSQRSPREAPGVMEFALDGKWLGQLPLPTSAQPPADGPPLTGARFNAGFEGITLVDGTHLWGAYELPLAQDSWEPDLERGGSTRLVEWVYDAKKGWRLGRSVIYNIHAVPNPEKLKDVKGYNGISEILELNGKILVMERGNLVKQGVYLRTFVRVYQSDPGKGSDVSAMSKLSVPAGAATPQRLFFDFDSVVPKLSPGFQNLDNLEALCWGPSLKNGKRALIALSDNNFNPKQRTQWIFLEYTP